MPLARNWTACSGVLFNYFQCSGLFNCVLCSTPPVQSKIASFSSLTLRSQRRWGTVSPCPPKPCFAVTGSHTLGNKNVRKVHTSALIAPYSCSLASHLILRYPLEPLPPWPCSKESSFTPPPPPPEPPNSLLTGS